MERTVIPFIAMSGKLDKDTMIKTLSGFHRVGIDEVMLYPRTGVNVEYMSDDWRDVVGLCIEYAKQHDMRIWLYDEVNWPSGSCNGQVTYEDDRYFAKRFLVEQGNVYVIQTGFRWDKSFWPFDVEYNDLDRYYKDESRFFMRIFDPVSGELLQMKEGLDIPREHRRRPVDLLNPEAVNCFIRRTHEKYYQWFGENFGTVIPGIFTDEPTFRHMGGNPGEFLYYDGILEEYRVEFGCELLEDLVAHSKKLPDHNFVQNHLTLVARRFRETFLDTIRNWCHAHGIVYTGHLFEDESLTKSLDVNGNLLHTLRGFDVPGVDEIFTKLTYKEKFLEFPVSAGATIDFLYSLLQNMKLNGVNDTMVELFAVGPYNLPFAQRARAVWFAAAHGINHYFIGLSHMDGSGNYKRTQYFTNCSYATNDFEGMRELALAAKNALVYAEKAPEAIVSVRYPFQVSMNNLGKNDVTDYDFLLKDCIEFMGKNQIQWRLINEGEEACTDFAISFDAHGVYDEKAGVHYETAEEWFRAVQTQLYRTVTVTEMSGALAEDVFVRTYCDGSFIIINRSDSFSSERNLILEKDGKRTVFRLYDYGVYTGEEQEQLCKCEEILPENLRVDFHGNSRYTRLDMLGSQSFEFWVEEDIEAVLNICVYPRVKDVYLDGEKIAYNTPVTAFTDCFNDLYLKSEPIVFERGTHVLTIPDNDRPFLPMIILEGDVDIVKNTVRPNPAKELVAKHRSNLPHRDQEFYGCAGVHFTIDVPERGAAVTIDDYHGLVEFYVDGELTETKAMAPYIFHVNKALSGKNVNCELRYYSSYQMLFGDLNQAEARGVSVRAQVFSLSPSSSKIETVGFHNLHIYRQ